MGAPQEGVLAVLRAARESRHADEVSHAPPTREGGEVEEEEQKEEEEGKNSASLFNTLLPRP